MFGKIGWFLLAALLLSGYEPARAAAGNSLETLQSILPDEVGGWKKEGKDQVFDSKTIFDYIDGAGEVYRAYNLQRCLARRYSNQGAFLTLDIFDMGSPADAYGVFTYDRQGDPVQLGQDGLSGAGWIRFWKGRFFVSVIDEAQTPDSAQVVGELTRLISDRMQEEGERPDLVRRLPSAGLRPDSIRFFHDPTILNTHYYLSDENILHLGPGTDAVLAAYRREKGSAVLLVVAYPSEEDARKAHQGVLDGYLPEAKKKGAAKLENGSWSTAAVKGRFLVFVLEAGSPDQAAEWISETMNSVHRSRQG